MNSMVRFRYSGFYDVPRGMVVRYRGRYFYLGSPFDENVDEYPDEYSVYLFPESLEAAAAGSSWDFVRDLSSLTYVGSLSIKDFNFDKSKRKKVDATVLDRFLPLGG